MSCLEFSPLKSMEKSAQYKIAEEMQRNSYLSLSPKKEEIVQTQHLEENFSSPTPVKTKEPSRIKSNEELTELPEKYRSLLEIFERMTSSFRLLCLKKKTPTFHNISSQVKILTGRQFLFIHLAQIKYILPEAVQIDKILIHDEKTKCMKSDLKMELLLDVVKDHDEESPFVALSNLFSSRLRDFHIKNPEEDCDIAEAPLPEPFNQKNINIKAASVSNGSSVLCETEILNSSHLPPSYRRHFYQKDVAAEVEKTVVLLPVKSVCEVNEEANGETNKPKPLPGPSSKTNMNENTPMKLSEGNDNIFVETPVQSTPMRSISPTRSVLTCEDETKTAVSQNSKQPTSAAKKSLDFNTIDGEETIFSNKQTSVCLSDLVVLIHQIFKSVNFRPITREELVQKIIMNNFEIDDHNEATMQMEHLEKLVPDWFCKKLEPSGDLLYHVKKVSDLNSVCERVNII